MRRKRKWRVEGRREGRSPPQPGLSSGSWVWKGVQAIPTQTPSKLKDAVLSQPSLAPPGAQGSSEQDSPRRLKVPLHLL